MHIKFRAPTVHIYAAAACLLNDIAVYGLSGATDCRDLIDYSISYLSQLEDTSTIAKIAVRALKHLDNGRVPHFSALSGSDAPNFN